MAKFYIIPKKKLKKDNFLVSLAISLYVIV
jgi:hypothetical protein